MQWVKLFTRYRRRDPVAAHKLACANEDSLFDLLSDEA